MIKLTVNGRQVEVQRGATLLDAAQAACVHIPTLCWDEDLEPYGGCRLCIVHVEGLRGLPPSCTTRVAEGFSPCNRCAVRHFCGAPCPAEVYAINGRLDAPALLACGDHDDMTLYSKYVAPSPIGVVDLGRFRGVVLLDHLPPRHLRGVGRVEGDAGAVLFGGHRCRHGAGIGLVEDKFGGVGRVLQDVETAIARLGDGGYVVGLDGSDKVVEPIELDTDVNQSDMHGFTPPKRNTDQKRA